MKQLLPLTLVAFTAMPAVAQEQSEDPSLMEQGLELFFEGLREEMAPTLDDFQALAEQVGPAMQDFVSEMGPALADIASQVEDWSVYEMPEILPNGDIIIRRKPDTDTQEQPAENGATDI